MTAAESAGGVPPADLTIDAALVRALIGEQHPDLASLPLAPAAEGWDNCLFRLGDRFCVRLPRRGVAAILSDNEQRWLPSLAARLPLQISAPLRTGRPSARYPFAWSILPWIEGETADIAPPLADQAPVLSAFLRALHVEAPDDAPRNPVRGVALATRAEAIVQRIERLSSRGEPIGADVRRAWDAGCAAPLGPANLWLHGDLHARNVLVRGGALVAVIDWGDISRGDPATDLAAIWMLFNERTAREAALDAYGPSQARFLRGRGWAAFFAIVLRDSGLANNPALARLGAATMERLGAGP